MASYIMGKDFGSTEELAGKYNAIKAKLEEQADLDELDILFEVANNNRDLFPKITGTADETVYLEKWIRSYQNAKSSYPSVCVAKPKGSCADPAIRAIVRLAKQLTDEELMAQERHHNLFMCAENVQGRLLEEYIARVAREYGWIWCRGSAFRAVDFCNSDGSVLLQVKNKYNSENSSSKNIRTDTPIKHWYRLGKKTVKGVAQPKYMWAKLNEIINENCTENTDAADCAMCEEDYQRFLAEVTRNNPNIIGDQ